jgi:hypothetical protein
MATGGVERDLGVEVWNPTGAAAWLADRLRSALRHEHVVELVLFGSHARGGTTGFSDVDAILVISDAAAEEPASLRVLRRKVLSAQRAVLAYQPMQHHGFEVATPRLLGSARDSIGLPRAALEVTRSLFGRPVSARLNHLQPAAAAGLLAALLHSVATPSSWPSHPWSLHRLVSMFELIPAAYLQTRGRAVPKAESFAEARSDFGADWWPYDVLSEVRDSWPRDRRPALRAGLELARNPWLAVAAWRRLPTPVPRAARSLLTDRCLVALQRLATQMRERAA